MFQYQWRIMGIASIEPLELVAAAYKAQLKEHGPSPNGVLWGALESQQSRFELLTQIMAGDGCKSGISVNDLGCGYGALFEFLDEQALLQDGHYYGYDICADMLAAARSRICDPRAEFTQSMIATRRADYSFASGTFNLKGTASDAEWAVYVKESLLWLWEQSAAGLAFNLLDGTRTPEPKEWLYYPDPAEFHEFCRQNLTDAIQRVDDPARKDCTLLLRRDA
ncbi:MAG: class I SAM-dependent methyltransferase [Hyphomicrobiales bacterium]|nr:class I SAM-dependent methyltransferase [Hyphomicrobiales bacterium]